MPSESLLAVIDADSPRARDWERVFGCRRVPIVSPFPVRATAPGHPEGALFYSLDLSALDPETRARMVADLAERFDLPVAEVERDLERDGVPLLAEDVTVLVPIGDP